MQRSAHFFVLFLVSIVLFAVSNFFYAAFRDSFNNSYADPIYTYISLFLIVAAALLLTIAAFGYLWIQQKIAIPVSRSNGADSNLVRWSLARIFSDALFKHKRLFISSVVIYGVFFALLDGILIYQPGVDFNTAYAVGGVTWRVVTCCGLPGFVPVGLLYLPSQHIGIQLIPLSVLLMIFVSVLVGLNICLLSKAYSLSRSSSARVNARAGSTTKAGASGGIVGAALGLFVGCPTCAAAFLISMFAGTGAISFSSFIAAYQPIIAAFTLPLLFLSIFWQGKSIREILAGCATPRVDL